MSSKAFYLGECAICAVLASVIFTPFAGLMVMAYALVSVNRNG